MALLGNEESQIELDFVLPPEESCFRGQYIFLSVIKFLYSPVMIYNFIKALFPF